MHAQACKSHRLLDDRNKEGRKIEIENTACSCALADIRAKHRGYALFKAAIIKGRFPFNGCFCEPLGTVPKPICAMRSSKGAKHRVHVFNGYRVDWFFTQLVKYCMKQEHPQLAITFRVGTINLDDHCLQGDGHRRGVIVRDHPW